MNDHITPEELAEALQHTPIESCRCRDACGYGYWSEVCAPYEARAILDRIAVRRLTR